jgi:flagella basal body P-ring formation protein FlgA
MNISKLLLLLLGLASPLASTHATPETSPLERLRNQVLEFALAQTVGLPGQVSVTVGAIDQRTSLPPCAAPEAFLPAGARLWGRANVGVRCQGASPWAVYVPVTVRIMGGVVVAAQPLAAGRPIEASDLAMQQADLGQLPAAVVTDPRQAIGRMPAMGVMPGQPLRLDLMRSAQVIQQGQPVMLVAQGGGFRVSAEGKAVTNAADGQVIQVRTLSGRSISGVARPGGLVEVQNQGLPGSP